MTALQTELIAQQIAGGEAILGMELGSTRVKAVLLSKENDVIAQGMCGWENRLCDGIWTYTLEDIQRSVVSCYRDLKQHVKSQYGVTISHLRAAGISAMMHGYLAFDNRNQLLVPFRIWRNTTTGEASEKLTKLFHYNIPQRWSIAHLYQAILNGEPHVKNISFLTTLAGYVHWKLTGCRVLGIGDASGMFPIDSEAKTYHAKMLASFNHLIAGKGYPWKVEMLLPAILQAGEYAGSLTASGAQFLDPDGDLQAGAPFCPPEGDAGTGMVATNSIAEHTGNVSAGTSIFSMIVLDKPLKHVYRDIDLVITPSGKDVAMVHCNNCSSDLNAWVALFEEFSEMIGVKVEKGALYPLLFKKAMRGDADCGNLLAYNFYSGEPILGTNAGYPLFVRTPDSRFTLSNFMKTHLFAAFSVLKMGHDILAQKEHVQIDGLTGHGGIFKTPEAAQSILAAALNTPVTTMDAAGEGGSWGIALLAAYMVNRSGGEPLADWLSETVFRGKNRETIQPDPEIVSDFERFFVRYKKGIHIELAAIQHISATIP